MGGDGGWAMIDFELLIAAHRAARRLPLAERFRAAVKWVEAGLLEDSPTSESVVAKLVAGQKLTPNETRFVIDALSPKPKQPANRPRTPEGRDLELRFLVRQTAREFQLTLTRGDLGLKVSACDAVAEAMRLTNQAPRGFDRVRKIYVKAAPEESAVVGAILQNRTPAERQFSRQCSGYLTIWA